MTLRMAVLLAVVIFLTAATVVPRVAADELVAKDATVVVLKHVSPSWLMNQLGLVSAEDSAAGKAAAWYRSAGSRTNADISPLLPGGNVIVVPRHKVFILGGIDIVVPCDRDKALILYGTSGSIADLRKVVRMLDVPQKQVQVKAVFYRLPLDRARQMGLVPKEDFQPAGVTVARDPSGLLKSLKESKDATLIGAPVISTINNQKATTSITQRIPHDVTVNTVTADGRIVEEKLTQFIDIVTSLSVLPRVNGDGTITLFVEAKAPGDTVEAGVEELKAHMRLEDGDSMVAWGPHGGGHVLLLIVTPTVVGDQGRGLRM